MKRRYEVFMFNVRHKRGLEATMYTHFYPNHADMMRLCRKYGIGASDFEDTNNCMDPNVRVIYGRVIGNTSNHAIGEYQITKLTNDPVTVDELLR